MAPARTRTTDALSAAGDAELGSAAQRERRKRILDATLALASRGGYDAVQMRTVAERADVALGTLYRYFPSKIHLLVSALTLEFERTQEKLDRRPIPGDTPWRAPRLRRVCAGSRAAGPTRRTTAPGSAARSPDRRTARSAPNGSVPNGSGRRDRTRPAAP